MTNKDDWKVEYFPQSQWPTRARELGIALPQELKDEGRCGTTGKETGTDVSYHVKNEDGVAKLFLQNFRASSGNPKIVLIDASQAQKKEASKVTRKQKRRTKSASDTSTVSDKQTAETAPNSPEEKAPKEDPIAKLQAEYRTYKPATASTPYLQKKGVPCVPGLRQDRQDLIVPFSDENGEVTGLQRISPDGMKRFEKGSSKTEAFFIIHGLPDTGNQYVLVCEGLSTGISLWYSTFATVVVAGSAGQMNAGTRFAKLHFPGWPVVCCADNDNKGEINGGLAAAKEASLSHGCFLAVPPADEGEKVDFNDLHQKFGRTKVLEVVNEATKLPPVKIPSNFRLTSDGLFVEVEKGTGKNRYTVPEQISKSPLEVEALAKPLNEDNSWELLVRWKDPDGCWQTALLPNDLAASDPKYVSSQLGKSFKANWNKYRNHIYEYLAGTETERRVLLADHCGWVGDLFVTPNRCFGFSSIPVQPSVRVDMAEFTPKGSLDDFRALTSLAQGNRIFIVGLCGAAAAPLLGLLNLEPGGFHFVGQSSSGKTTALVMATAFWRDPKYLSSWNTTDNALEFVASKYHDSLLTIDEISQVTSQALYKILYMLANGAGKKRCTATKSGVQEAGQRRWRLFYLSTGEEDVDLKLRKDGFNPMAGQAVRLATIPVEEGHIRNLHGYGTDTDFLTAVRNLSASSFGVAGERFLEYLTAYVTPLRQELPEVIAKYEAELCKPYCADGRQIDNQVRRVATRFALCIVGGCLASAWGIIDVSQDEIVQALTDAFASWVEHRGGTESTETLAIVEDTLSWLQEHEDRFIICMPENDGGNIADNVSEEIDEIARKKSITPSKGGTIGFIVTTPGEEGYYVKPSYFTGSLCKKLGKNQKLVKKALMEAGFLLPGDEPDRDTTRFTPPWVHGQYKKGKDSRKRFYRIFYPELF